MREYNERGSEKKGRQVERSKRDRVDNTVRVEQPRSFFFHRCLIGFSHFFRICWEFPGYSRPPDTDTEKEKRHLPVQNWDELQAWPHDHKKTGKLSQSDSDWGRAPFFQRFIVAFICINSSSPLSVYSPLLLTVWIVLALAVIFQSIVPRFQLQHKQYLVPCITLCVIFSAYDFAPVTYYRAWLHQRWSCCPFSLLYWSINLFNLFSVPEKTFCITVCRPGGLSKYDKSAISWLKKSRCEGYVGYQYSDWTKWHVFVHGRPEMKRERGIE